MESNYYSQFVGVLGEPSSIENLNDYISFCMNENMKDDNKDSCYVERHHILPRAKFPESLLDETNLVTLSYVNHCMAHFKLAKAYPIGAFLRTLNWMVPRDNTEYAEFREMMSNKIRTWWTEFRSTPKYEVWIANLRIRTSEQMRNGKAKHLAELYYAKPDSIERQRKLFISNWKNPEIRNRILESRAAWMATPAGKAAMRVSAQNTWDNRSDEFRSEFTATMTIVNRREDKRRRAGVALKSLWETDEFRQSVMDARKAGNDELKRLGKKRSNSIGMKEKWADPIWKAAILENRRIKRESEKHETD